MQLEYYRAAHGNFGDDLNAWLWPQLLPGAFDRKDDGRLFVGIGSILHRGLVERPETKVVFGAGARSAPTAPKIGSSWDIRFVRGPHTAKALGLSDSAWITDAAAAMLLTDNVREPRGRGADVAFMPHYLSMTQIRWRPICAAAGVRLIDPRWSVDRVLSELRSARALIAEAMHGAIVADLLRVPWVRVTCHSQFREGEGVSEFKWADWGDSLGVDVRPVPLPPMTMRPKSRVRRAMTYPIRRVSELSLIRPLVRLAEGKDFRLSDEGALNGAVARVEEQVDRLRRDVQAWSKPTAVAVSV